MAEVSPYIKCLFNVFKVLFAVYAVMILGFAITEHILYEQKHGELESSELSLTPLLILGFTIALICVLRLYGHTDNSAAVTAFLVLMTLGSSSLFVLGIHQHVGRALQEQHIKLRLHSRVPLDVASEQFQEDMNYLQKQGSCCGLFSATDWRAKVPASCHCLADVSQCHTAPSRAMVKNRLIFKETCFPVYLGYVRMRVDITVAVTLVLAVLSFLGMVLSSIILYQLGRPMPISFTPVYNPDPIIHIRVDYNTDPNSHTPENDLPPISHTPENDLPSISHTPENDLPSISPTTENDLPYNGL